MSYPIRMGGGLQSHVSHLEIGAKITYKSQGLERWFSQQNTFPWGHEDLSFIPRKRKLKIGCGGACL